MMIVLQTIAEPWKFWCDKGEVGGEVINSSRRKSCASPLSHCGACDVTFLTGTTTDKVTRLLVSDTNNSRSSRVPAFHTSESLHDEPMEPATKNGIS